MGRLNWGIENEHFMKYEARGEVLFFSVLDDQ